MWIPSVIVYSGPIFSNFHLQTEYPVAVFLHHVRMILLARSVHISILIGCKCCCIPARVSLLYTCVDAFFYVAFLSKTPNTKSSLAFPFPICLVS